MFIVANIELVIFEISIHCINFNPKFSKIYLTGEEHEFRSIFFIDLNFMIKTYNLIINFSYSSLNFINKLNINFQSIELN